MIDATVSSESFARWPLMALLVILFAAPASAAQAPFEGIVVFGTSLSDPGNAFALTGENNTPPDYLLDATLVPDAPYARGGHHLSNGATWVEQFARPLGLAGSVRPAFRGASGATNYAVDGARAYENGINVNLASQVGRFLQDVGGVAPPDALYVIEMGSNDLFDALRAQLTGGNGDTILQAALASIASQIQSLYAAGARHFLIFNVTDVGLTPAVRSLEISAPGIAQLASLVTQGFNAQLENIVGQLEGLPGVDVARIDAFQKLHEILADPAALGLTNTTEPCITPGIPPFQCQKPDEYVFWDGVHPTKAVHALFAQEAAVVLGL